MCFEELRKRGCDKALVQEFLHSEEQEEIGLMGVVSSNGEIIIPATIRKIRSYPMERGSTSYARIQPGMLNSVDEFSLKKFIACTGYSGLFDIEMIVKGGRAYFIEINFRNGQYGYSITCAGFNLPDCYSRLERGVGLCRVSSLREVYYMNEREDRRHVRDGVIKWRKWKCEFRGSAAYGMYCPGDQRPFVRQYVKIPDRVKLRLQRLTSRINGLIYKEEWTLAFRERKGCLLYQEGGKKEPFCILSNSLRYWAADPFIVSEGESDFVFFEMYDRFRGKGVIGCREIERGSVGAMRVVWEERRHLSFPYVFKSGGEWYMMPESSEADDLHLLRAKSFPWAWEPCRVVKTECKVCDSVFIEGDDGVYLLTTPLDCDSLSLMAYRIEEDGFASKQGFSAVDGPSTSRMAGAIFRGPEGLIRPSQDCSRTYGERINFSVIRKLDISKFEEECIGTASPEELSLSNARESFEGLHTYNCDARYEVIDLKLKKRIQLGNIINLGYRALMRFMP
ncbi:MAG: hypothetical protein Q4B51_07470 [Coriobacteriaceae bacterium]|nr:hypothetical protein [Coriobacteriaceae bacterium]